jgi:hypothetical protein
MAPLTEKVYPLPPDCYTEVHDLVQRHRIAPAELPVILDVSAGEAEDLLAAVPAMVPADRRDHPGPLASLPRNLWRETASVVFDPEHAWLCEAIAADAGRLWAAGFPEDPVEVMPPSHKRMAATSAGLAAALLAPAALGAGLYAAFAVSPHSVTRSHETAIVPPPGSQQPTTAVSDRPHPAEGAALGDVDLPDGAHLGADTPDADAPSEADHADEGPYLESASDQVRAAVEVAQPVAHQPVAHQPVADEPVADAEPVAFTVAVVTGQRGGLAGSDIEPVAVRSVAVAIAAGLAGAVGLARYAASNIAATPWPPPTHIVSSR